jgi:hypothetical protein
MDFMRIQRSTFVRAASLAVLLALAIPGPRPAAQTTPRVVDMDGLLVLCSDGRVFSRVVAALDDPVRWVFVTTVETDTRPVAIRHLADAPDHFFIVLTVDGEVYRYDGLKRRVDRTGNIFGSVSAPSVKSKTIGGEKVESIPDEEDEIEEK